jgi:hypothetical protein
VSLFLDVADFFPTLFFHAGQRRFLKQNLMGVGGLPT